MDREKSTVPGGPLLIDAFLYGAGTLAAACCGLAAYQGQGHLSAILAGILGLLAGLFFKYHFTRDFLTAAEALQDILIPVIFAASVRGGLRIWQAPATWNDLLALTGLGATLFCIIYVSALLYTLAATGRHPRPLAGVTILLIPYLFNGLLLLGAPGLISEIGATVALGPGAPPAILSILGRAVVLGVFNEAAAACICLLVAGRWIRDCRIHGLLLLSAAAASLTPDVASLGSGASVSGIPSIFGVPLALCAAVVSQAGLWGQTFLITGMFMDAIHGKNPTWYWDSGHYRSGFAKGAVYGLVFMAIIHGVAILLSLKAGVSFLLGHTLAASALIGAAGFPLVKTILETFDGSERFFQRAGRNYLDWVMYLRGLVIGVSAGYGLSTGLPGAASPERFLLGIGAGAAAYAGVDLVRDALDMALGKRQRFQSWRVYALAAALGGGVGGALAWYLDEMQIRSVTDKFLKYAALHYPAAGMVVEDYVIYPLCSRWGAMNLGQTIGGVRLFYNEALSGVVNWSLAAPLFSINLTVLTALLQRSSLPLRELFTRKGLVGLVEQAVRVLRWGLWMAPVIYSFLRISPDPTWYNQDGAIRTVVAGLKAWSLDPLAFRSWSLNAFLCLLAYDWLRVLIYLDHMGLRVATLVNLSFVGADMLDEKAARAIGHSGRTRCIPEGLRRFGTWAPLLIPFYLPRGAEWDYVWSRSAVLHQKLLPGFWPAVYYVAGAFLVTALSLGTVSAIRRIRGLRTGGASARLRVGSKDVLCEEKTHVLTNGVYTVEVTGDGKGYSRVFSAVRKGFELDITRRPDDPLQLRGKFFYLTDRDGPAAGPESFWSIGFSPVRRAGGNYKVTRTGPLSLLMTHTYGGIRAEARLSLDPVDPVEHWQVLLYNLEDRPRRIELLSYQEFGMNNTDAYRRHPFFNQLHAGTRFVRPINAILCGNRLLKGAERDVSRRRMTGATAFHAVKEVPAAGVTLLGYEDSRTRFINKETLRAPAVMAGDMRSPEDEGLLYTFDPIASLLLRVDLGPLGSAEVHFVDGYGPNEGQALELLTRHMGIAMSKNFRTWQAFSRTRELKDTGSGPPYAFSARGDELSVGWDTPRPWAHVMANALGYGTLITNDGSAYSFMGNSQQNGLTPFDVDSVPSQAPGQVLYVMNLDTGETDSPTYIPFRRKDAVSDVLWGRGYAVFRKKSSVADMELSQFVLPDRPAEVRLLKIRNHGADPLCFRVVPFIQIMLGETPVDTRGKIEVQVDRDLGALFFSNPRNEFYRGWAFAATSLPVEAFETIRQRFLGGPDRDLTNPFMLENGVPDETQPDDGFRIACFAGTLRVPAGGEATVSMVLGQTGDRTQALEIIKAFKDVAAAGEAFLKTKEWWDKSLSVLQVETDDPAFDRMVNGWLPYQVLVARLWGKIGPNQRSGACGYRDQLQDVLPFLYMQPEIARSQILLHAAQQFLGGDVLQWWHQTWEGKTGIGVRGRASDPHLWLPYMVCRYVKATGDWAVLDEQVPFLEGRPLRKGSESLMFAPRPSRDRASLYVHCLKAIDLTLKRTGAHGLPLLGTGDWNDGLDTAGFKGRGESVWMGFFLHDVLVNFADLAAQKEGPGRKAHYAQKASALRTALSAMWRGDRYVRAITDDGQEMSKVNALTASWSIISGVADFERGCAAMETALRELEKEKLVQLFNPPYTESDRIYPGRLADYPPGIRENAGQYSHGVSWLVDALLVLSDMAQKRGLAEDHRRYRSKAVDLWRKISPLSHLEADDMAVYGLPPHQQAADVSYGPGYEGRGGWSWYTGGAGRMLYAAYGLLGLRMEGGKLIQPPDLHEPRGSLMIKRIVHAPSDDSNWGNRPKLW